ncbi:T6SS immunity protein Tdi1 domain-containing protein [Deinococcus sp. UYEF24]
MKIYDEFLKIHKPETSDYLVERGVISKYEDILPEEFLSLWKKYGFCSFHNGLFWLIDPDIWKPILGDFISDSQSMIPLFRGSFGDIIYMNGNGEVFQITPILGTDEKVFNSLSGYMSILMVLDDYYKDSFIEKTHKKALKKLGKLKQDECYGFEPLLAIGGSESEENIVKVKLREHLSIIAQISYDWLSK